MREGIQPCWGGVQPVGRERKEGREGRRFYRRKFFNTLVPHRCIRIPLLISAVISRKDGRGSHERCLVISPLSISTPKSSQANGMTRVGISEPNLWICLLLGNQSSGSTCASIDSKVRLIPQFKGALLG